MMAGHRTAQFIEDERGTFTTSYGPYMLRSAFQPIFSQKPSGQLKIEAFEALIRAERNNQPVPPPHFFASVEEGDGLYVDTLCRELHILNMGRMRRPSARLFINFNPGLFTRHSDIERETDNMSEVTARAGLRPSRIVCEITEQGSEADDLLLSFVRRLRNGMFKIAVDDYGAEDSDIQRVDRLKPDVIKFDAAWVRRFTETSAGKGLLRLMVKQFLDREIECLFEGLEEDSQVDFCQEIGVRLMQGYALARPELAPTTFDQRFPDVQDEAEYDRTPLRTPRPEMPVENEEPATVAHSFSPLRRSVPFGRRQR